jgi:hypothetical protein
VQRNGAINYPLVLRSLPQFLPSKSKYSLDHPTDLLNKLGSSQCSEARFRLITAMYKKLRKAAADLGADAVIVSGQSQGFVAAPGAQSTVVTGNIAITTGGSYAGSYPKNQGIAIKYSTTR